MIIEKTGNIFDTEQPAIGHGVNCWGVMGAGIALQVKNRYPEMFEEYQRRCRMGTFNPGRVFVWEGEDRWIFNLSSQNEPGPNAKIYYLSGALYDTKEEMIYRGITGTALPRIGCGIGGLQWDKVLHEIRNKFEDSDLVCEVWTFE